MDRFLRNKPGSCKDGIHVNPQMKPFKTQLCVRFKLGTCGYGSCCNFAHGVNDLRSGPGPKSFSACVEDGGGGGTLCRVFYNWGQCGYDNCRFRHVSPVDGERGGSSKGGVMGVGNRMPAYKRTRLCNRWEIYGSCKFGNQCTYAHGLAGIDASSLLAAVNFVHAIVNVV